MRSIPIHVAVVFASSGKLSAKFDSSEHTLFPPDAANEPDSPMHTAWDVDQVADLQILAHRHVSSWRRYASQGIEGSFSRNSRTGGKTEVWGRGCIEV